MSTKDIRKILLFIMTALLVYPPSHVSAQSDNTLIEFRRSDAWDIRCVDYANSGQITCDLYLVINYKPHPDFRAIVMMVFLEKNNAPRIQIDFERQTAPEQISTAQQTVALQDCGSPCVLTDETARQLVAMLDSDAEAIFSIKDFSVESFEILIDTDGFKQGLIWLQEMQTQYRM